MARMSKFRFRGVMHPRMRQRQGIKTVGPDYRAGRKPSRRPGRRL
jgi:hypothetical protein